MVLVADCEVKSMLRVSPLKEDCSNAQMAGCPDVALWLLAAEALWALMYINEIGYCHTPTISQSLKYFHE